MAPLRSSRTTRNQDHAAAARSRTGVLDLDPTDGLPVTKWSQISVRVNQDTDFSALNPTNTASVDWSAQFNTPQFPWPESPLPTYLKDVPSWNQEMIRRARVGSTNAKLSVWDRKTSTWISAAEAEKKANEKANASSDQVQANKAHGQNGAQSSPKSDHEENDSDSKSEDEHMQDEETTPFKTPISATKRRKTAGHLDPREIEVKRWTQVPVSVAEKTAEPKFLADRRPGMPALYNLAYQNTIFGAFLSDNQVATASYDLGDGGGLGNAAEMLGTGPSAPAEPAPVRRNMPPKRKKKKIGGPGRKKANVTTTGTADGLQPLQTGEAGGNTTSEQESANIGSTDAATTAGGNNTMAGSEGEDASDSGSEEGSEEGEIEEDRPQEMKVEEMTVEQNTSQQPPSEPAEAPEFVPPIQLSEPESLPAVPDEAMPSEPVNAGNETLLPSDGEVEQVPITAPVVTTEAPMLPDMAIIEPVVAPDTSTLLEPVPSGVEILSQTQPEPALMQESEITTAQSTIPGLSEAVEVPVVEVIQDSIPLSMPEVSQEVMEQPGQEQPALNDDLLSNLDAAVDQNIDNE